MGEVGGGVWGEESEEKGPAPGDRFRGEGRGKWGHLVATGNLFLAALLSLLFIHDLILRRVDAPL